MTPPADQLLPMVCAPSLAACDVVRGVSRLLLRAGVAPLAEVALGSGRRADILGLDNAGRLTIVEIKVSLADLRGDRKWPEYLGFCDRFFWAVPAGFDLTPFAGAELQPDNTGLIVADRFDAEIVRPAPWQPLGKALAPARRKAETLAFARRAALRMLQVNDPDAGAFAGN
jgi:hypothetical protein